MEKTSRVEFVKNLLRDHYLCTNGPEGASNKEMAENILDILTGYMPELIELANNNKITKEV